MTGVTAAAGVPADFWGGVDPEIAEFERGLPVSSKGCAGQAQRRTVTPLIERPGRGLEITKIIAACAYMTGATGRFGL